MTSKSALIQWDIFCRVVDNFGDIGVCWRLARILSQHYQRKVRLWVDDLMSFTAICPDIKANHDQQHWQNIEICRWDDCFPNTMPADIVIETFGCAIPEVYLQAMAECHPPPVWINLEYLSAEPWVDSYHGLVSPHPTLPLNKYFFFPGFTDQTGGVLYTPEHHVERQRFQSSQVQQHAFWQTLALPMPTPDEKRISLFCYENHCINALLHALAESHTPYTCLLPQGPATTQVAAFFQQSHLTLQTLYQRGNVQLYVLPFIEQNRYDQLLWACDINFVRGEDSFVRAQLAARPFIWQIYPQAEQAHRKKLMAFLTHYAPQEKCIHQLWQAWNGYPVAFKPAWHNFTQPLHPQAQHATYWAQQLMAGQNLAEKLILFCQHKMLIAN